MDTARAEDPLGLGRLGISLDPQLLELALTHRSYAYEAGGLPTNERLEFLGDAVLSIVVTEHLYTVHPDLSEGQLAKLRAAVVNSRALAEVAQRLGVGPLLRLGRGEETTGGRTKASILGDAMEAIIGAVFISNDIDTARVFVHALFDPLMKRAAGLGAGLDWKTSLQEIASLRDYGVPVYDVTEDGPDHAKTFTARVNVGEAWYGPGSGTNKKQAEQQAAEIAWAALQDDEPSDEPAASAAPSSAGPSSAGSEPVAAD